MSEYVLCRWLVFGISVGCYLISHVTDTRVMGASWVVHFQCMLWGVPVLGAGQMKPEDIEALCLHLVPQFYPMYLLTSSNWHIVILSIVLLEFCESPSRYQTWRQMPEVGCPWQLGPHSSIRSVGRLTPLYLSLDDFAISWSQAQPANKTAATLVELPLREKKKRIYLPAFQEFSCSKPSSKLPIFFLVLCVF